WIKFMIKIERFIFQYRGELKKVSDKYHLHSPERPVIFSFYMAKQMVNCINHIGTYHTHFINDNGIQSFDQFSFYRIELDSCQQVLYREKFSGITVLIKIF